MPENEEYACDECGEYVDLYGLEDGLCADCRD